MDFPPLGGKSTRKRHLLDIGERHPKVRSGTKNRIKQEEEKMYSSLFSQLMADSKNAGETNDCTVKAVAVACGVDYTDAHNAMRRAGRKSRRGAYKESTEKAVKSLGCTMEKIVTTEWCYRTSRWTADATALKNNGFGKTIKTAMGRNVDKNAHFIIFTRGHAVGATGGQIHDWTDGRQHRIKQVWKITRPTDAPITPATPAVNTNTRKQQGRRLNDTQAWTWCAEASLQGWTKSRTLKEIRATGASISVARWTAAWNDYYN